MQGRGGEHQALQRRPGGSRQDSSQVSHFFVCKFYRIKTSKFCLDFSVGIEGADFLTSPFFLL